MKNPRAKSKRLKIIIQKRERAAAKRENTWKDRGTGWGPAAYTSSLSRSLFDSRMAEINKKLSDDKLSSGPRGPLEGGANKFQI